MRFWGKFDINKSCKYCYFFTFLKELFINPSYFCLLVSTITFSKFSGLIKSLTEYGVKFVKNQINFDFFRFFFIKKLFIFLKYIMTITGFQIFLDLIYFF